MYLNFVTHEKANGYDPVMPKSHITAQGVRDTKTKSPRYQEHNQVKQPALFSWAR